MVPATQLTIFPFEVRSTTPMPEVLSLGIGASKVTPCTLTFKVPLGGGTQFRAMRGYLKWRKGRIECNKRMKQRCELLQCLMLLLNRWVKPSYANYSRSP